MPKVKVIYTIHDNGDGSASAQFHSCMTAAEKALELAMEYDCGNLCEAGPEVEEMEAKGKPAKINLIYTISNNGDGSASVHFHKTMKQAEKACRDELEMGEAFCDNDPVQQELIFDAQGVLTNPDYTLHEILTELAEKRGEEPPPPPAEPVKAKLDGLTVVFTGTVEGMTRKQMEQEATDLGATIAKRVTPGVSFLIVGEKPGSKVKDAKKHEVSTLTPDEWRKKVNGPQN